MGNAKPGADYRLAVARPCERASGEGIILPVRVALRGRLCERPPRKFEVSDGLSRANGLFQPLRRLAFTAPGITNRATLATDIRSRRPDR
jgi:hypothetical protein